MYRWMGLWIALSSSSLAQEVQPPALQYQTDATMSWVNGGENWKFINQNRAIGITRAGISLSWMQYQQARLSLTLRPDALLADRKDLEGRSFEFERRAGSVYQSTPQVEFLDLYQLQFDFSDSFALSAGVYPDFSSHLEAYASPLAFGLRSEFPVKFSGIQLLGSKRNFPLALASAPAGMEKELDFSLYAFNGSKDRVETLGYSDRSFDYGPEAVQPRKGVAASVTKYLPPQWTLFGLAGTFDTKEPENRTRSSLFSEAALRYRSQLYVPFLTSFEVRWLQDKWQSEVNLPLLNQESITWKLQVEPTLQTSYLLGVHWGRSERMRKSLTLYAKDLYEGHQLEAGVRRQLRGFLFGNLMVSYEKRMKRDDEGWKDGFSTTDGSYTRPSIYRISLELTCLLGSS